MRTPSRLAALTLAATAVALPIAGPVGAKAKKPKPPTTATIKKLLSRDYCAPTPQKSVVVTFKSIKRGKRRIGSAELDGTPANRKTYVFPIRAAYYCDYKYTDNSTPEFKASDRRISGDYSFFRDEFGTWTEKNHGHKVEVVRGTN